MRQGKHFSGVFVSLSCFDVTWRNRPLGLVEIVKVWRQMAHLNAALSFSAFALDLPGRAFVDGACGASKQLYWVVLGARRGMAVVMGRPRRASRKEPLQFVRCRAAPRAASCSFVGPASFRFFSRAAALFCALPPPMVLVQPEGYLLVLLRVRVG